MAEGAVLGLAKAVVEKLGSRATDQIQSAWLVKTDLEKLERSLDIICYFIEDAEKRQLGSAAISKWVKELKQVVYDIDDLLDETSTDARRLKLLKRSSKVRYYLSYAKHILISCFCLSNKIEEIFDRLHQINSDANHLRLDVNSAEPLQSSDRQITYALPNISSSNNIKGRDEAKCEILGRVLSNDVDCCHGLSVLPIVGIGGLGKTTLAQLVYSDPAIGKEFEIKLWGCVSDPFDLESVLRRILESIGKKGLTKGEMRGELGHIVQGQKYFMVLDDVWTRNVNEWNSLKEILACDGAKGGVILVTTRDRDVATKTIGAKKCHNLEKLPSHLCMSVFLENAFMEGEQERFPDLVKVGEAIVKKCGGVPLALKTLGSSLRGQRDEKEWQRVAESDLWNTEQKKGDILPALKLSYDALDSQLKSCFAYLSIFPQDTEILTHEIIYMWIAHGFIKHDNSKHGDLEGIGYKYVEELSSRSLLEVSADDIIANKVREFKMHDLVHDLAMHMMGEELGLVSCDNPNNASRFVRHLAWDEDDDLSCEELPKQLTFRTQQVRTFTRRGRMVSGMSVNTKFIEQVILTFKCLRYLCTGGCDVEEIPDSIGKLKHLRFLDLSFCRRIKALPLSICELLNLQALDLFGCVQLEKLPIDMGKLINLRRLSLTIQSEYMFPKGMRGFGNLPSFRTLDIYECKKLISLFPEQDDDVLGKITFLTQLRELWVWKCPKLSSFLSNGLVYLTSLVELCIIECESLDWQVELQPKLGGKMPMGLHNLETLYIRALPKLVGLPDALKSAAPSLRYLHIEDCEGLTSLPDWMRSCKSLNVLDIEDCPNLSSTFPVEVLTALQRLVIKGCPNLSLGCDCEVLTALQRLVMKCCLNLSWGCDWEEDIIEDLLACEEDSIEGWCPLISHIPDVSIHRIKGHEDVYWEDGIRK